MHDSLSRADISDLVYQLLAVQDFGWYRDARTLARALGFRSEKAMREALFLEDGRVRLSLPAQLRAASALVDILSGRLVIERRLFGKKIVSQAVLCDDPKPLNLKLPVKGFVSVSRKGVQIRFSAPAVAPAKRAMPTFKEMWEKISGSASRF